MANLTIATLAGVDLPPHFSYRSYVPRKRMSVTATANAVVTQAAEPHIVHGDGTLPWSCRNCMPSEYTMLWTRYNQASLTIQTFLGYWGESYEVYFNVFDPPSVRGRLFNLSGQFQVISVTVAVVPECEAPGFPV